MMGPLAMIIFLVFLGGFVVAPLPGWAETVVRVGVYQNSPGVFTDAKGNTQGFYIDLLESTATKQGWMLTYVPGSWTEGLTRLEKGEIDLLTAIAYTRERDKKFDFNQETALINWGQVYVKDPALQSIPDLEGKTIVGLENDIYSQAFQSLLGKFDIFHDFIEVSEYAVVLQQVAAGNADAGIVSRTYGLKNDHQFKVNRSTIVCCPMEIRFAAPEGRNRQLLDGLDTQLRDIKKNKESLYFKSLNKWFGVGEREVYPRWVVWSLRGMTALLFLLLVGYLLLRKQVNARTSDLRREVENNRLAEKKLQAVNQELEAKARDLELSRQAAEAAGTVKSQLLTNMSHELRTPLNTILGMTEMAFQTDLPGEARAYMEQVRSAGLALSRLIHTVLDFSELDREAAVLNPMPFDLREIFRHLAEFSRPAVAKKPIGLTLSLPAEVPFVLVGDAEKLEKVLMHLVDNAIKFTESGKIEVSARTEEADLKRIVLCFTVSDTGVGIPQQRLSQIFDSFVQGDGSLTRQYGGTGIGLSVCKHLVELMTGRIWVESHLGQGSVFHFNPCFQSFVPEQPQPLQTAWKTEFGNEPQAPELFGHTILPDDNELCDQTITAGTQPAGMERRPDENDAFGQTIIAEPQPAGMEEKPDEDDTCDQTIIAGTQPAGMEEKPDEDDTCDQTIIAGTQPESTQGMYAHRQQTQSRTGKPGPKVGPVFDQGGPGQGHAPTGTINACFGGLRPPGGDENPGSASGRP